MSQSPAKRPAESVEGVAESTAKRVKAERYSAAHAQNYGEQPDDYSDEEDRDASDSDSDLEDDEKNVAAYIRAKQQSKGTLGVAPNAGYIKQITLKNFMNHGFLTVKFGPKMNFLVGHNGSGKSAILTAIAIVLGAKAAITGRGHSVKDLIKRGQDRAEIVLTMANQEPNAFEHEKYGDNIIIERTIDKSGASGYKFRATKDGKILGSKREVIAQICSHFDIDIDSPLTILTQDAAKSFLAQSDPHKLYAFFLRGTKLSDLADSYEKTKSDTRKIEINLAQAKENLPELERKVERLHREVQAARKIGDMRLELATIKVNLAWGYVKAMEEDTEIQRTHVAELEAKRQSIEREMQETVQNRGPLVQKCEELKQEIAEHNAQRKPIQDQIKLARKEMETRQTDLTTAKSALAEVEAELKDAEKEIAALQQQLDERAQQSGATQDPKELELRAANDKMEALLSNMRRSIPVNERELSNIDRELQDVEQKLGHAERQRDGIKRDLDSARERRDQIQRSQNNKLEAFGRNMNILMDEISRARWRRGPPIGPIGQYVQLTDMRYRTAIESWMGGTLCSFIVLDNQDNATLHEIFQRCEKRGFRSATGRTPSIIRFSGDMFDFSDGDLTGRQLGNAGSVETVIGKLKITNDIVVRAMVNQQRIEKVLVAPDVRAADELVNRALADPRVAPVQVLSGGDQPFMSVGKSRENKSSGPVNVWRGAHMFVEDFAAEASKIDAQIRDLEAAHQDVVRHVSEFVNARNALSRKKAEVNRNIEKASEGIPRLVAKITANKDELERLQPIAGDVLVSFKNDRENEVKNLKAQAAELEGDRQVKQAAFEAAEAKQQALIDQDRDFVPEKEKKDTAFRNLSEKIVKLEKAEAHWISSLERTTKDMEKFAAKVSKAEQDLEVYIEKAQQMGESLGMGPERRESDQEIDELNNRRQALDKQIAEAEQRSAINLEKAASDYNAAKNELQKQQDAVHTFEKVSKMLKKNVEERMKRWELLRHHLAVRARTGFVQHLNTRNMDGALHFQHDEDALNINVESTGLGDTQGGSRIKAPQELSGGERSYVTVCFLLALWDLMPSTIRCLDEWDVFLDMINRQLAARMLIEGAKESTGKQYVLITPQDMGGVNVGGGDNRLIRLQDPTRNQGTLQF